MSLFSKKAYVGLDIGHHALKAVQVERTPTGWHVARSISAPTPVDTVRDGVVIDPVLLGLAIKNMLKAGNIHATSAAIAISGGTVVVRPVRMPKMAESALRKSIRFEASRYVPNSVEDSYIEFEIIGDADATNMDVIIAAAPKELVDSRIQACENAGLEVEHVEVATFAAYRSVVEADLAQTWSEKTLGLVDIGATVTNLGVVSNGVFSMTRAIPAGGQVLTDALKSYFKLSDEDAESGKSQLDVRGLMNEHTIAENPPLRVLHTHVDDLVREVRRSINYWQSQQNEGATAKRVDAIILVGGGANLPGLAQYFEHKLGIPTEAKGLYENPRFIGAHSENDRGMEIGVAVGLGMGLSPTKIAARAPKPMKLAAEASESMPPRSPKPPKSPKPTKGKTFKVSRPVEDAVEEVAAGSTTERVEVAASMATVVENQPQGIPQAFQPRPEVKVEAKPDVAADTAEKYGPEVAALLGAAEEIAPTSPPSGADVAALLDPSAREMEPIAESQPATFEPEVDEKAALLKPPTAKPVQSVKPDKAGVFGRFAKAEKTPKQAKPEKVMATKEASASGLKSKLGSAAAWMFGSPPKEHVKPTGMLAPKADEPTPIQAADNQPQIELLRGPDLDTVELTLREAKPAPTKNPPSPKVLAAAAEPAKAKTRKAPVAKKPQVSEAAKTPKKEAA